LAWAIFNKAPHSDLISWGTNQCDVEIKIGDDTIKRTKGKSTNLYSLNGVEFKAFGLGVPDEISKLLNMDSTNIQNQHDSPWWFQDTAGEVSRHLNRIVDLSIIDTTLANLDKLNRKKSEEKQVLEKQLETAKTKRSELAWIKKAQTELETLVSQNFELEKLSETRHRLSECIESVKRYSQTRKTALRAFKVGICVVKKGEQWKEINKQAKTLEKLRIDAFYFKTIVSKPIPSLLLLFELDEKAKIQKNRTKMLSRRIDDIQAAKLNIITLKKQLQESEIRFKKEMGYTCALCGNKLLQ
jgi:hypothetical protein